MDRRSRSRKLPSMAAAAAGAILCLALLLLVLPPSSASASSTAADGCGAAETRGENRRKLWVFGDSYADTGNLGDLGRELTHSWYTPYGQTFPRRPAGRFSDGRVLTDFVDRLIKFYLARQRDLVALLSVLSY